MPLLSVHHNHITLIGNVFLKCLAFIELSPELIEIGNLQAGPVSHGPRVLFDLSQQNPKQRGLAAAVRSDDADFIAPHDGRRKIRNQGGVVIGKGNILCFDDQPARPLGILHHEAHIAASSTALLHLASHLHQGPHPSLITGSPCLDTLPEPDLFALHMFVKLCVARCFVLDQFLLAGEVILIIAGKRCHHAPVEFHDAGGYPIKEGAVVGDKNHGFPRAEQELLHPDNGIDIKMIGRLIKHEDVGLAYQRPRQEHSPFQSGGKSAAFRRLIEAHAGDGRLNLLVRLSRRDNIVDGTVQIEGYFLWQQGCFQPLGFRDHAAVGRQLSMDQSEQCGFTGTVATDQTDPFTPLDLPIRRIEECRATEAYGHILEGYQRHSSVLPNPAFIAWNLSIMEFFFGFIEWFRLSRDDIQSAPRGSLVRPVT